MLLHAFSNHPLLHARKTTYIVAGYMGQLVELALLLLAALVPCCQAQALFPNRFSASPCTLLKDLDSPCQLKSKLGYNPVADSFNGLYMRMGEMNCTVKLEQCRPGTCYSIRDLTSSSGVGTSPGMLMTSGWFSDVQILSGAEDVTHTREGVAFKAVSGSIMLQYSTQLCADYWSVRDAVGFQPCNFPVEAVTIVGADTPNALSCST